MIAGPRVGRGILLIGIGALLIAVAVFAAAGGATDFALGAVLLGAAFVATGFWVRLFHQIELRLIDIQRAVSTQPVDPAPVASSDRSDVKPAENYLG